MSDSGEHRFGITALGSGSDGNAYVLHCGKFLYLVDAGFSRRELCARMEKCGVDPLDIRAVLISHEHGDHVKGCRVFADAFRIPAYIPFGTVDYLARKNLLPQRIVEFSNSEPFALPGVSVNPFPVQHDALDTVGFEFRHEDKRIAVATDIGCLNLLAIKHLKDAEILILETNYDQRMLLESDRKISLKHRIMGSCGHLDNRHAAEALGDLIGEHTRTVLAAHISRECNDPEIISELFCARLKELNRPDIDFRMLTQDTPEAAVWID